MAEERNLGLARAPENATADPDATKEELQRRMEEARENITQTVTEIKETVVSQYQQVRETINDTLDWREQYKRHTLPITIGALSVGAILGYSVGGALFGGDDYAEDEYDYEEEAATSPDSATRSYAATPITGRVAPFAVSDELAGGGAEAAPEPRPAYAAASRSLSLAEPVESEPERPGLLARFKETRAYDRLQEEVSGLGDRVVDELSKTAQTVVLPLLLSKIKELIGIDLNTQRDVAKRTQLEQQTARANAATSEAANAAAASNSSTGVSSTSEPGR